MRRVRRAAWLVAVCALTAMATAQVAWTVQTVALRDLREANAEVARLSALGLPAYTEFTMADGLQYVRVRFGCYDRREAAEAWVALVRGRTVRDAVAVPTEAPLPNHVPCVEVDVGFLKPATWALVSRAGEQPTFRVEVGGHVAFLRHDGQGWRLWQSVAPEPEPAASVAADRGVRVGSIAGQPVARTVTDGPLCPGTLLTSVGPVAIVDWGDAVVACRVAPPPP